MDRTRKEQIRERQLQAQRESEANKQWIEEQKALAAELEREEQRKVRERVQQRRADQELLLAQIAEQKRKEDILKQEQLLQEKRAARYHEAFEEELRKMREDLSHSEILDRFPRKVLKYP